MNLAIGGDTVDGGGDLEMPTVCTLQYRTKSSKIGGWPNGA